jgi:hypothetical protein
MEVQFPPPAPWPCATSHSAAMTTASVTPHSARTSPAGGLVNSNHGGGNGPRRGVGSSVAGHGHTLFRQRARDLGEDEVMNSGQFRKGKLHGKQFPKGEHHPKAKLTATQVLAILRDPRPHHAIARDYGIHHTGVSEIKTGKTWRHVTAPLTDRRGSQRRGHIKLTHRDVELIRQDSRSLAAIAHEYGVGRTTIWNAKHRVSYKHVP